MMEYKILDVKVNILAPHILKNKIFEFLKSEQKHHIVTVNPEFVVASQKNKKFLDIINRASLATIDGSGIIKALQYTGKNVSLDDRITGVELTKTLINIAVENNLKILFCLWSRGVTKTDKFFIKIKNDYPALNFQVADEKNALEKATLFAPDIVLVGFGAPRQDIWIDEHLAKMPSVKIAAGVGGTFDFLSGRIKRAPKFMRSFGLEWLWRLLRQPNRLARINRAIFIFPYLVYKNQQKLKKYGKNKN